MKGRKKKNCSSYKDCKLFLDKNWLEVIRVDYGTTSVINFIQLVSPQLVD